MRFLRQLVVQTVAGFYEARAPTMASSIAYFALATLAPLGVLTLWIGSFLLGPSVARSWIHTGFNRFLGPALGSEMARLVGAQSHKSAGSIAGIIGILFLLYGAGSLFLALQHALDVVWRVRIDPDTDVGPHVGLRALIVFAIIFLPATILAMVIVSRNMLGMLVKAVGPQPSTPLFYLGGRQVLITLAAWAIVATLYTALPDASLGWKSIALGSGFAAVTMSLGTWLFGLYFSLTEASRFRAAGSLVALLIWVFLMAQLFLAGARLAYEHGCLAGHPVEPRPWAELYDKVETDTPT